MDLGLRSDPNLHRAHHGPFRVRIEARQRSGWSQQDFWESVERADRPISLVIVMERNVEEERAHIPPARRPSAPRQREMPAASRTSELPLSRFPLRGKAGGGFPPRRWHAVCRQKALAHIDAAAPPARGVSRRSAETPLAHPPIGGHRNLVQIVSLDLRTGEKINDGRHVGLDFYDLLIEGLSELPRP